MTSNSIFPSRRWRASANIHFLANILALCSLAFMLCACGLITAKESDKGAHAADAGENGQGIWPSDPVPYTVKIEVRDGPKYLKGKMEDLSQLAQLKKEPPDSLLALERRGRLDQETAQKLMQSQCFYDGRAELEIDDKVKPAQVTLVLYPGRQFTVGHANVHYDPEPVVPPSFMDRTRVTGFWGLEKEKLPPPSFPSEIPGIVIGKPVVADDMLAAVEKIPESLRKNGYPLARTLSSIYTLDKPQFKLNADVTIDPGPPAYMGKVLIKGDSEVSKDYLAKLVPWTPGKEVWDDALLQDYANTLRSLGVFNSVEVKPLADGEKEAAKGEDGVMVLPAILEVVDGPPRSISASARYDTDTGFGVEGIWEHRNLFGNGEKLTVDVPISQQLAGIKTHFEKPAFIDRETRLLGDASALWENTDAYQQESLKAQIGLNRHLARQWWGGVSLFAEGGWLKDDEHEKREYGVFSPRAGLRYDGRNNRLNPSSGMEMEFHLKPFSGFYEEDFHALAGTLAIAGYYPLMGRKPDGKINDKVVLAGRVEGGAMPVSSSLKSIPASLRYFTGGAGSVRGYVYQSIGPRNSDGDPLGGRSYQVVNLESRFMVAENIGIVPFLDGGMVYRDQVPHIIGDMDWGAGLGLRYYTPIGPVRLDVATPLRRIDDDPPVQFYISIGQSF